MAKKKEIIEKIKSPVYEDSERDIVLKNASKPSIPNRDKFEELGCEDENEGICEEDMDEEGLNMEHEDKKHYDTEETELENEGKENLNDRILSKNSKKK